MSVPRLLIALVAVIKGGGRQVTVQDTPIESRADTRRPIAKPLLH